MNKKLMLTIGIILAVVVLGGGAFAYVKDQDNKKEADKMAMQKKQEDQAMKDKQNATTTDSTMQKTESTPAASDAMASQGAYITQADYDANKAKYNDYNKAYFFYATWCPTCQSIDKAIIADPTKVPKGSVVIKTDFDTATALKQKYGVTTQTTFVTVDNDGNSIRKWTAASVDDVTAGLNAR